MICIDDEQLPSPLQPITPGINSAVWGHSARHELYGTVISSVRLALPLLKTFFQLGRTKSSDQRPVYSLTIALHRLDADLSKILERSLRAYVEARLNLCRRNSLPGV